MRRFSRPIRRVWCSRELADRVRAHSVPVTPEIFKQWLEEIKQATGVKGKELFHPVRIALTGSHSGPEFDRLIPVIEQGATLGVACPASANGWSGLSGFSSCPPFQLI